MAINDPTKRDKANTPKQWRTHLRTVTIVLTLEGILFGAWAMIGPESPETVLLKEQQRLSGTLQKALEEEKKKTREANSRRKVRSSLRRPATRTCRESIMI